MENALALGPDTYGSSAAVALFSAVITFYGRS
jgi:hypothetical protein